MSNVLYNGDVKIVNHNAVRTCEERKISEAFYLAILSQTRSYEMQRNGVHVDLTKSNLSLEGCSYCAN
jgi:hypothetical protein